MVTTIQHLKDGILAVAFGALLFATTPVLADPPCENCGWSASGTIVYQRHGSYQRFPAQLSGVRSDCATLKVAGTTNPVQKMKMDKSASGRTTLTLNFRNPPALGAGHSVLLVGTLLDNQSLYYGDIYEKLDTSDDCVPSQSALDSECGWVHKGGFHFTKAAH